MLDEFKKAEEFFFNNQLDEASLILKKIIDNSYLDINYKVCLLMGKIFLFQRNLNGAFFYLNRALEKNPDDLKMHLDIWRTFLNNNLSNELLNYLNNSFNDKKKSKEFYLYKSRALQNLGKTWLALINISRALKIDDLYIDAHFARLSYFPYIYKNNEEIRKFRNFYEKNLDIFIDKFIRNKKEITQEQSITITSRTNNFLLPYQGYANDKELQIKYSKILEYFASFITIPEKIKINKRINIGFISGYLYNHTVTNLFKAWITCLDKNKFNVSVFNFGNKEDDVSFEIKKYSNVYHSAFLVNEQIDKLISENLDIAIFLDIGMSATTQLLSVLKIANQQCVTWGHPITTGSDYIDYYLSSELMESNNAQDNYTEKLIKLNNIGILYDFSPLNNYKKISDDNELDNNKKTSLLCLQNLRKIIPDTDNLFNKLISRNMNSNICFISDENIDINKLFQNRLQKNLKINKEKLFENFKFLPPAIRKDFIKYIHESTVILDTPYWSGGNTNLEAIFFDKPVVTFNKKFSLKGNHTYAFLKYIELDELIADNENEYIEIVNNLVNHLDFRNAIIKKIKKNKHKLFDKNLLDSFTNFIYNISKP